jgi:Interferon-induced transmembrane protein
MTYGDDSQPHDQVDPAPGDQPAFGSEPGYLQGPAFGGGQQPYGYGRPPVPGGQPPTHFPLAIVSLLFCWPASIVAIIYASQVKNKWSRGDQQGAMIASRRARTWAIVSFAVGILAIVYLLTIGHTATGSVG